ncbi:hypothetical protein B0H14DRAFT_2602768 [Mycena olivaceomarginata]|nr:hypothetical protein B0H14DRAFT_2602768 [Mycena olivaceomarginata]
MHRVRVHQSSTARLQWRMKRGCIKYIEGGSGASFSIHTGSESRVAKGASVSVSALDVEAEGRAGRAWRCRDGDPNNLSRSGGAVCGERVEFESEPTCIGNKASRR